MPFPPSLRPDPTAFPSDPPIQFDADDFHLRDARHLLEGGKLEVTAALFPLIAVVIRKWISAMKVYNCKNSERRVYLVSGAGLPRNPKHNELGNSTEDVAKVMEVFIKAAYPEIVVEQLPSHIGVYRCVLNVCFGAMAAGSLCNCAV